MPTFNNRPNRPIPTPEGETVWISRSVALVGQVCVYNTVHQQWYVLLVKRGSGTPDFQGFWCLPCGYLDWDETLTDGFLREVFEETGLYLPSLSQQPHFGYSQSSLTTPDYLQTMPWAISDNPGNGKQNISLHFAVFFSWHHDSLPTLSDAYCEPNEVAGLQWATLDSAMAMTMAFNHQQRVKIMHEQLQAEMQAHVTASFAKSPL
jgi:8-oxo-dGTP pyrophosphatase MutT (NUDIX family)